MNRSLQLTLLSIVLVFIGCEYRSDDASVPVGPNALQKPTTERSSLELIEEDFAAGLIDRENGNRYRALAVFDPDRLPPKYRSTAIGKDATYSMLELAKDWRSISPSLREEIRSLEARGFGELKEVAETDHFILHYTTQGGAAVPPQDVNNNGRPDFIDVAMESWERVWNRLIAELGYPAPKGTPQQKYHVYYRDLKFYYGYTAAIDIEGLALQPVPLGTATSYIVVENDFFGFPRNDEDVTGFETIRSGALKVTQAHEFMHASHFNINIYQSAWLFESHATWAEDAVYDHVNDWHWYLRGFLRTPDFPIFNRFIYGSAFFMNYLSERYGIGVPRQVWFAARTRSTPDAVRHAAFGESWEEMKHFGSAEYQLDISDFTRDGPSVIPTPSVNVRATHNTYPVNVQIPSSTNRIPNRAPWGLGSNFVEFVPGPSGTITISFDGTDGFAWRASVVATPRRGAGRARVEDISLDAGSAGSITLSGFGVRWSKVTLVPTIADRPGREVPYSYSAAVY